jgi:hypothetical protein
LGVALSGAIMTAQLQAHQSGMARGARALIEQGMQEIAGLPEAQREIVLAAYRHAISTTFLAGAAIIAAAFVLVLFLPEHPLKSGQAPTSGK